MILEGLRIAHGADVPRDAIFVTGYSPPTTNPGRHAAVTAEKFGDGTQRNINQIPIPNR